MKLLLLQAVVNHPLDAVQIGIVELARVPFLRFLPGVIHISLQVLSLNMDGITPIVDRQHVLALFHVFYFDDRLRKLFRLCHVLPGCDVLLLF